jgi:hypothetical protein
VIVTPSIFKLIRKTSSLVRVLPTFPFNYEENAARRKWKSPDFVYDESINRDLKIKPTYECRCDGRLQTKRFTCHSYTGLVVELEHLKIKTRLTNEKFPSVKGECEILMS